MTSFLSRRVLYCFNYHSVYLDNSRFPHKEYDYWHALTQTMFSKNRMCRVHIIVTISPYKLLLARVSENTINLLSIRVSFYLVLDAVGCVIRYLHSHQLKDSYSFTGYRQVSYFLEIP